MPTDSAGLLVEISVQSSANSVEGANRLQEIALVSQDKSVAKAAKKALYLLSQKGIAPSTSISKPSALQISSRLTAPLRAWMSNFDGAGNQSISIMTPGTDGGYPIFHMILVNDVIGVKDWFGNRVNRVQLQERMDKFEEMLDEGIMNAEIDPDYALWSIQRYYSINYSKRILSPQGFPEFLLTLSEPTGNYEVSPAYSEILPDGGDTAILDMESYNPKSLFIEQSFNGWFFDVDDVEEAAVKWREADNGSLKLPEDVRQSRKKKILADAVNQSFDPETRACFVRRLEDTAYVLNRLGEKDIAKSVLFHAKALKQEVPASEVPFAQEIIQRTIEMAEMMSKHRVKFI